MRECRICKTKDSKIWKQVRTNPICNSCYCKEYYKSNLQQKNKCTSCNTESTPKWFNSLKGKQCSKCYSKDYRSKNKDKVKETLANYNISESGKKRKAKYEKSAKGKKAREKALLKYVSSEHGYTKRRTYTFLAHRDRKKATPKWLSKDHKKQIRNKVKQAKIQQETLGIEFHIDHIIPVKHPLVSGLNVPWNLQVITASENLFKNNKFDGTYNNDSWRTDYIKLEKATEREG